MYIVYTRPHHLTDLCRRRQFGNMERGGGRRSGRVEMPLAKFLNSQICIVLIRQVEQQETFQNEFVAVSCSVSWCVALCCMCILLLSSLLLRLPCNGAKTCLLLFVMACCSVSPRVAVYCVRNLSSFAFCVCLPWNEEDSCHSCCSVLQCAAGCCSVRQDVALCTLSSFSFSLSCIDGGEGMFIIPTDCVCVRVCVRVCWCVCVCVCMFVCVVYICIM